MDITISLAALILLSPIMLMMSILVYLKLGSPVIFRQERPGLHGKPFVLYKFRTMRDEYDSHGNPLLDGERLTPLGILMRKASLDELPELLNVLRGDMSLVGPRPLLMRYFPYFTEREQLRHTVRPGITGWAQINGRNMVSWDDRLELDAWYVETHNWWLDLKILFLTVPSALRGGDIVVDARSIMLNLDEERALKGEGNQAT